MHALSMADSACARGGHKMHVYIDHDNVLEKQLWDDVLVQPVELPKVISPCKKEFETEHIPARNCVPTFSEHMLNMMSGGYGDFCKDNTSMSARRKLSTDFVKEEVVMTEKGKENLFPEVLEQDQFAVEQEDVIREGEEEDFVCEEQEELAGDEEEEFGAESEEEDIAYQSDSSVDPDFADSDYDFEAGYDTLFDENVDTSVPDDIIAAARKEVKEDANDEDPAGNRNHLLINELVS